MEIPEQHKLEEYNTYDRFIRSGLNAGFTDDQLNWLWGWMKEIIVKSGAARG